MRKQKEKEESLREEESYEARQASRRQREREKAYKEVFHPVFSVVDLRFLTLSVYGFSPHFIPVFLTCCVCVCVCVHVRAHSVRICGRAVSAGRQRSMTKNMRKKSRERKKW